MGFKYILGNDYIHALTVHGNHELKIVLTDWSNDTKYAHYTSFRMAEEEHGYYLSVWGYSGNAGTKCSKCYFFDDQPCEKCNVILWKH